MECNWCMKSAIECFCAKIQTYVIETIQDHQKGKMECKIVANNMYSVLLYYACEKATLKSIDPNFEKGDIKDFTQDSVHALIIDLCPNFEFKNNSFYPNISCTEWDINTVPWAMFKCCLQPFFKTFMEVISHVNEISNKSLNKCTVHKCDAKISINHLNKHLVCPCARSFQSNELVHLFPVDIMTSAWALRSVV